MPGAGAVHHIKSESQFLTRKNTTLPDCSLAQRDRPVVYQEAYLARVGKIKHRSQQRKGGELFLLLSGENRRGATQDCTADTETKRMSPLDPGDTKHDFDCSKRAHFEIIVPCQMTGLGHGAAPRNQKYLVALCDCILDERIPRAKVKQNNTC